MTRFYRIFAVFMVLPILAACSNIFETGGMMAYTDKPVEREGMTGFGGSMSPRPFLMRNIPGGDENYSQGFRDGCSTTINFGVGLVRSHPFKYDVIRGLKDKEYYAGYRAGTVYCTYFADVDPL